MANCRMKSRLLQIDRPQIPWKLGCIASLSFLLYTPLYPSLIHTWINDSNNSHGLIVPAVSLYLVWQLRDKLKALPFATSSVGFLLLILSLVAYSASYAADLVFPARITIITTLAGLVLFNCSWKVLNLVLFPIVFLVFMVPVPDTLLDMIAFPLQLLVSDVSAHLIDWYGIPVYREGNLLYFARYSFEVTEACSGIRSLVSFLAIGALFAYVASPTWPASISLILSTVPLAVVVNLVRVTGTGILANYLGSRAAKAFLHDFSGFLVFGLGLVLMVGELWVLKKVDANRRTDHGKSDR